MKITKGNNWKKWAIMGFAVALVCWDFTVSTSTFIEEGTYRYESEFDAFSAATVKVSVVTSKYKGLSQQVERTVDPGFECIQEMVDTAIMLQGGFQYIINKGNKVLIKVNLVGANSPSGEGENTDVRVVKALIKNIHEFTGGDVEIIVAEGTARTNDDPTQSGSVWDNSGYRDLLTDPYLTGVKLSLLNLNQSLSDLIEVDLGNKGTSAPQGTLYKVHKAQLEADVYIAVPVLKIHDTGITCALKLQIGTAPGCYYGYNKMAGTKHSVGIYHDVAHRRWTTEAIVDLSAIADIDFVLVDAIMCLESYKAYKGDNQVRFNTVVAGADPVAVDHVCAKLMCLNPDDIAHITLAEKIGLGTNDPKNIHIVGSGINDARIQVKTNTSSNGKYGQSNRTWILSETFTGTKVTDSAIPDEAALIPEAGKNGWTEPVYFFDDRIDLSSFYKGAININTYAFTKFYAPNSGKAELWLGYQEGIIVYLNGAEVFKNTTTTTYSNSDIGSKKATIDVLAGENTLLVKSLNAFGDYSFALNICENNGSGKRVEGLKFYLGPSGGAGLNSHLKEMPSTLNIYPNPCSEYVTINLQSDIRARATILVQDLAGRLVKEFTASVFNGENTIHWDLCNINGQKAKPGTYLIYVSYGRQNKTGKLIIK
jgi:uncharacterized protein (DUF362 family)